MAGSNKSNTDENSGKGDPNTTGSAQARPVRDDRAALFTPTGDYNQNEPLHSAKFGTGNDHVC